MTFTYTAGPAVTAATKAERSIDGLWADAYAAAAHDIETGGDLRGLADAITKAGTKCSKDTALDYVTAARLTAHGKVYADAIAAHLGEGKVMRAHSLTAKARKARGVAYVRAVLASLDGHEDTDALAKAMRKAVRELDAAKRPGNDNDNTDTDAGESGEVESGEVEVESPGTDAAAMLAALTGPTVKLREAVEAGDIPAGIEAWMSEVARIARAVKAAKADAA